MPLPPAAARTKRTRLDWEAIERDFRTGRYSLRELAAKHATDNTTIARKISKDRAADETRWQKDLSGVVLRATKAKVMAEMVSAEISAQISAEISDGRRQVSSAVAVAAEMGAQVILGHRTELLRARRLAMSLLEEVETQGLLAGDRDRLVQMLAGDDADAADLAVLRSTINRALGTGSRVSSIKQLADTFAKLHAGERVAFGLDEGESDAGSFEQRLAQLDAAPVPPHAQVPAGTM